MNVLRVFKYFFLALVCFLMAGCNKFSEFDPSQVGEATLTLQLNAPGIGIELKSVSSSPTETSTWSQWERAVDGRYLYRVTAFLLDGNRLVAVEDLNLSGEQKETTLTFNGNFTHGTYKLMVVANYSAHTAEDGVNGDKSYGGLDGFADRVQSVIDANSAIDNFTTSYSDLLNFKIASEEGICKRVPQPLTLIKDIELHPGSNEIEGELSRTYSRIRIEVENQSDEELSISSLNFSGLFTQTEAYIFDNVGPITARRAMNVAHANAITPFTATTANQMKIAGKQRAVVFDAYILESKRSTGEEDYSYKLNLGYGGMDSYTLASTDQITKAGDVTPGKYLILNTSTGSFLVAGSTFVEASFNLKASDLKYDMELSDEYVWTIENASQSGSYYIGTANADIEGSTAYYMYYIQRQNKVELSGSKSDYFTFGNRNSTYVTIRSNSGYYLRVYGTSVEGRTSANNSCQFRLYSVNSSAGLRNVDINLETIDISTGQSVAVEEIKRNDFINAVVSVSYTKNKGHFQFEVKDWVSAGGDVSFN